MDSDPRFAAATAALISYARAHVCAQVINANAPASAGPAFQVCGTDVGARNTWIYMVRQETYIQIAVQVRSASVSSCPRASTRVLIDPRVSRVPQGVVAGLGIGFFVILISTQNFIVAGIGTHSMGLQTSTGSHKHR
mgnify:CR=1 FL=1